MAQCRLVDYEPIVGREIIGELRSIASRVAGRRIKMINSTAVGGGVAEILNCLVPLLAVLMLLVLAIVLGAAL